MSRPKPKILLEITNKKSFKTDQVLESDAVWSVFYQDKPINLKTSSVVAQEVGPKYKKVSFANSGHAFNLSEKFITFIFLFKSFFIARFFSSLGGDANFN